MTELSTLEKLRASQKRLSEMLLKMPEMDIIKDTLSKVEAAIKRKENANAVA